MIATAGSTLAHLLPNRQDYAELPKSWRRDVLAGITVGVVALPLALVAAAAVYAGRGRALAGGQGTGLVKMLADAETDEILGVHIFGANASELISECVVAMEFQGCSEDLARIIHAHPTLSEAIHEAALHLDGRAIHRGN